MHDTFSLLICVIILATVFDFINGFHDTANAIATSVATRVLSPGRAVAMAGILHFPGARAGPRRPLHCWEGHRPARGGHADDGDRGAPVGYHLEPAHVVLRTAVQLQPRP